MLLATVGACSDDGLVPDAGGTQAGSTSGNDGNGVATSSVNTSDTVTASGSGDDSNEGKLDIPPVGDSTGGADDSGDTEGADSGTGLDTGEEGGSSTGGAPPEPECVMGEECGCNPDLVSCDLPPPECPPDLVPLVDDETGCWDGACVPIEACFTVFDCEMCDDDEACVSAVNLGGPQLTCQPIDPGCVDMVPTCECMPTACDRPFFQCVPTPVGSDHDLTCVCPTC